MTAAAAAAQLITQIALLEYKLIRDASNEADLADLGRHC
jgi:hypothetical protein